MLGYLVLALSLMGGMPVEKCDVPFPVTGDTTLSPADAAAIAEFNAHVRDYCLMREAIGMPSERIFSDPRDMQIVRKTLRDAIRERRPLARQGDIFTDGAAAAIRHIVAATAAANGLNLKHVKGALRADRLPGARPPEVNETYDWRLGAWMWPALLLELPPLPEDVQYRIVDDDLVLIDIRADLVLDILDDALEADED